VVGSGLAGLWVALRAARRRPVLLVTKAGLTDGSSSWAQGGIAAAVAPDDSAADHLADTLTAGAGLCDPAAAGALCREAAARIGDLVARGVRFDEEGGRLALGREGAHSARRVLHAGGDATGRRLVEALAVVVAGEPRIAVCEREMALDAVVRDGVCVGLRTRGDDGGERVREAAAVVLATGGAGQLYARTTNPPVATADGPALAARAGAAVADLEMVQFHPTALAVGESPLALVSEAVRGEGAVLRDARGRAFMRDAHPAADLGPRDVVARAIAARSRADGQDVVLDLRHLDPDRVHARFPTVSALCARAGLDLACDPIPVTPAAHYAMGGVLTDLWGRSTLHGLYAVGECAATGVHGANRLASNSLLEAVVFAERAAVALDVAAEWPAGPSGTPGPPASAAGEAGVRPQLQRIMWDGLGVERDAAGLAAARRRLAALFVAADAETRNLQEVAGLAAAAAELRAESRGAHFRRDRPAPDPRWRVRIAWAGGRPHELPAGPPLPSRSIAEAA
jgi:L-aspartate oxidase